MPGRSETAEGVLAGPRGFLITGLVDPRVNFMDAAGFGLFSNNRRIDPPGKRSGWPFEWTLGWTTAVAL